MEDWVDYGRDTSDTGNNHESNGEIRGWRRCPTDRHGEWARFGWSFLPLRAFLLSLTSDLRSPNLGPRIGRIQVNDSLSSCPEPLPYGLHHGFNLLYEGSGGINQGWMSIGTSEKGISSVETEWTTERNPSSLIATVTMTRSSPFIILFSCPTPIGLAEDRIGVIMKG